MKRLICTSRVVRRSGASYALAYATFDHSTLVPRKPNYDFDKRRKEQLRKAKKDAKLQRKRENAESERAGQGGDTYAGESPDGSAQAE